MNKFFFIFFLLILSCSLNPNSTFWSKSNYVAGITHNVLGYATQLTESDFVGLHLFYMDSGEMDVTTVEQPNGFGETFSVTGLSLRGIYTKILRYCIQISRIIIKISNIKWNSNRKYE